MLETKAKLYASCLKLVNERVTHIEDAMRNAQASANEETKSSAGDKYETGRAMMHLEKEKLATQLSEVSKMKMGLDQINPEKNQLLAELGSVVITSNAKYFLSVSLGQIKVEDEVYFAISPASPIGRVMFGKKKGDSFDFGGKQINLLGVG
ncbi:3-oxoacyl-ACP synthase [Roseivirga echinicomitans]